MITAEEEETKWWPPTLRSELVTDLNSSLTLNCRGKLLDLSRPVAMAILNLSPDSFYHSLKADSTDFIVDYAGKALEDGATILDVGGMSTRPGSAEIEPEEEWSRVGPAITAIRKAFPTAFLSIDSYRAEVVSSALDEGIDMVNDISGGMFEPQILEVVKNARVPYVLMHNRAKSSVMQKHTDYKDLNGEVMEYFFAKIHLLREKGISDIIVDPGFGFSKTIDQNYELLKNLEMFGLTGCPVLAGLSRKSMMYRPLGLTPQDVLPVSTALNFYALSKGAKILRVHDVKETVDCIRIFERFANAGSQ